MAHKVDFSTYDKFLDWCDSLGDRLPDAAYYLQGMISYAVGFGRVWHPQAELMMGEPSGEAATKESRILSKLNAMKGADSKQPIAMGASNFGAATAWDGTILRQIFAFLQANPQLVAFLLSLLKIT